MQIDHSNLQDLVRKVLLPAVVGGAGGGALSAYTSAKAHPEGETPEKRRQRILRNAMVGTALGGTAGAAIPTGLSMLTQPYFGAPPSTNIAQRGANHLARNAGSYASGGLAAGGLGRLITRDKAVAFKHIQDSAPTEMGGGNEATLRNFLGASQDNRNSLISNLVGQNTQGVELHKSRMKWNDILSQAGYKGMPLDEMAGNAGHPAWSTGQGGKHVIEALKSRITDHAALGKYGPSGWIASLAGKGRLGTEVARRYAEDFLRPGTKMMGPGGGGRLGNLTRLGLAAGGTMLGKSVWDAASGD